MALRCDLPSSDLSVESWAHCLQTNPSVVRVAPHVDARGKSLKSVLPLAVLAAGGGHHAPHELKVYVDQSSRFLTTGVSNKDEAGGLHVYMRDPPKELRHFAKAVFEAAVTELSTWQRFRAPESGRVWRWRAADAQWFFEDSPGDWRQYVSPEGKKWWWNNVNEDWFLA